MTPKEQEIAIGELEERVDRLRNIYEQYFLGFEKLEPTVPRKDVDRRFAILRKEQIRNTAMRFRFQVVTQKFNTYAMHWVRICRQIEEGTYKRHVRKAKARFGDGARATADVSFDIDIDMDDFENTDFSTDGQEDTADTLPPPPPSGPISGGAMRAAQMVLTTPGTSFAVAGRREVLDEMEPNTPPPSVRGPTGERLGRGAALPAGSKPRILRKRDDTEPPPSGKTLPGGPPSTPRIEPAAPVAPAPRAPGYHPASAPRMPSPSTPGEMRPSAPRIAPIARGSNPNAPNPSAGRMPVGPVVPPPPGSVPGLPAARPAPPGSVGRLPVPPPSSPDQARARAPAPVPPPKPSSPGAPPAAPSSAGAGGPRPRPPMPSVTDRDTVPPSDPRPSVRPRPSLPLPSQLARPKKES